MTTISHWRKRVARAPVAEPERLIGSGGLVVLAPHPDDETIGCSALLRAAAAGKHRIGIVALTDGEGSHRGSASHPPARLAQLRCGEQEAAVARLGCGEVEWLRAGLPDGASARSPRLPALAQEVAAFCTRIGASAIAAPHPDDPHPDHHAAAALARAVRDLSPSLRLLNYEVWSRRLSGDAPFRGDDLTPFRLRSDPAVKMAALREHASQLGLLVHDDAEAFSLPAWFLAAMEEPHEPVSWSGFPGEIPGADHFARLYAEDGDPWHVRSSTYERDKRAAAVDLLSTRAYARSLEAGCGEGHLTGALVASGICREALGIDRDASIVERARRMEFGAGAQFAIGSLPDELPDGPFDLAIFSEVLYFLREAELERLADRLRAILNEEADLLLVSYKGRTDTALSGPDAADFLAACLGERAILTDRRETELYRMERLRVRARPAPGRADGREGPTGEDVGGKGPG